MKKSLFITGATGYIGTRLLKKINLDQYENIFCLGRKDNDVINSLSEYNNFKFIKADLSDQASYAQYLNSSDAVLHLAALTGKARPEEYFRVNSRGTEILLEQCKRSNIKHFIFVSSIAADFKDIEGYYYAHSKIAAEKIIEAGGLTYTIVRPTMVIGENSPILESLLKLAKAPVVPIFGNGRTKVQPVYIDDIVGCILSIIDNSLFQNQTLTIAGPEQITIEGFIRRLHEASYRKKLRMLHLPVRSIAKILLFLEKFLLKFLPFTAGQLASFTNDGIADRNPCFEGRGLKSTSMNEMLALAVRPEKGAVRNESDLMAECELFTNYLIGRSPDEYIQAKYLQGHAAANLEKDAGLLDAILIRTANSNSFFLKLADVYTSIFYRNAVLRKKLLLMLAILECCKATYHEVDKVSNSSGIIFGIRLFQKAFIFLLSLFISIIIFSPFRLYDARTKGPRASAELWTKS